MTKGEMMKKVYTEEELQKIDTGIPLELSLGIDTAIHVMNFNNSIFGKLENMEEVAKKRNIPLGYIVPLAVIDFSVKGLFIYDVDSNWSNETVEEFLVEQGRKISNCHYGVFDGDIVDLRNE